MKKASTLAVAVCRGLLDDNQLKVVTKPVSHLGDTERCTKIRFGINAIRLTWMRSGNDLLIDPVDGAQRRACAFYERRSLSTRFLHRSRCAIDVTIGI